MPTPVYIFTGFLDSGKSTLIKETLKDPDFMADVDRTLILSLEEGEEEYDDKFLKETRSFYEYVENAEDLTPAKMHELDVIYHPSQVFIEWNGTVPLTETILSGMPDYWPLVQILTTVNAKDFEVHMKSQSMAQMALEQLRYSDAIIFNRCTEDTSGTFLRGTIKAINKQAQIYYEGSFGEAVTMKSGTLPFDINAPVLDIKDDDYGLWYMDVMEDAEKYDGKEIILRGMYAENIPGYKQTFVLGRNAMVCCAQDMSLCGITVTGVKIWEMKKGDWIEVQGTLKTLEMEQGAKTVVLYASRASRYTAPSNPYVVFS